MISASVEHRLFGTNTFIKFQEIKPNLFFSWIKFSAWKQKEKKNNEPSAFVPKRLFHLWPEVFIIYLESNIPLFDFGRVIVTLPEDEARWHLTCWRNEPLNLNLCWFTFFFFFFFDIFLHRCFHCHGRKHWFTRKRDVLILAILILYSKPSEKVWHGSFTCLTPAGLYGLSWWITPPKFQIFMFCFVLSNWQMVN